MFVYPAFKCQRSIKHVCSLTIWHIILLNITLIELCVACMMSICGLRFWLPALRNWFTCYLLNDLLADGEINILLMSPKLLRARSTTHFLSNVDRSNDLVMWCKITGLASGYTDTVTGVVIRINVGWSMRPHSELSFGFDDCICVVTVQGHPRSSTCFNRKPLCDFRFVIVT